jgi:hypothetical protein
MKKILLVIVMITIFGSANLAFAYNNSFSDVPAEHWAYDAVNKLAQADIISGYDGRYFGDRTMSRYEFAAILAKAMDNYDKADATNKQLLDKLSAEFASELNKLGLRVAKVEAKTNVWVGGDTRFRILGDDPKNPGAHKLAKTDVFDFRQRIKFNGNINDNYSWQARVGANWGNKFGNTDSAFGSNLYLDTFNVTAKNVLGFDSIRIGRSALDSFGNGLIGKALNADGVLVNRKFDNMTFRAWTGNYKNNGGNGSGLPTVDNQAYQLTTGDLGFKLSKNLSMGVGYYWADVPGNTSTMNTSFGTFDSSKGYDISVKYQFAGLTLLGDYIGSKLENATSGLPNDPRGWVVQVSNGTGPGATAAYYSSLPLVNVKKAGDQAWSVSYRSVDAGALPGGAGGFDTQSVAYPTNPYNVYLKSTDNVNVLFLAYEYVVAPNVMMSLEWQDFKIKNQGLTNLPAKKLEQTYMLKFEFFY